MAVTVVGSINVDILLSVEALPRGGETVLATATLRAPGGKGANQAVAAARIGAATVIAAAVGDDEGGRWMRDALAAAGVETGGVATVAAHPTGTAYISIDARGENAIIVAAGANAAMTPALLPPQAAAGVVLAQLEIPVETIAAAFAVPGRIRILNAAPAMAEAAVLFPQSDVLIVNEHELASFLGLSRVPETPDIPVAARTLLSRPEQVVIVTLGAEGALAIWQDRHVHAPAVPVTPLDTVGAGDCFCGTLAALIDGGSSIERALPVANAAAALCTQTAGAIPAMPDRAAVQALLDRSPTEYAPPIKTPQGAPLS